MTSQTTFRKNLWKQGLVEKTKCKKKKQKWKKKGDGEGDGEEKMIAMIKGKCY